MQMQHRSEFFWFMVSYSFTDLCLDKKKHSGFCVFCMSKLPLSLASCFPSEPLQHIQPLVLNSKMLSGTSSFFFFLLTACPARQLALAKKHTNEECKECHEVNVMASQLNWRRISAVSRAWFWDSAQQYVCLSCHDGHLSCPQSVWEEFFFSS